MLSLAFRNLLQERGRFLISTAGVAFAITLILTMQGIYGGVLSQFTRVVDRNPTDVFVAARGIQDFFHGVSVFPASTLDRLKTEPRVKDVVPAISMRAVIPNGGRKLDLVVFGFDPAKPQGSPWEVRGGDPNVGPDDALVSETLAKKLKLNVGDPISFSNQAFRIRGLVPQGSSLGTHYVWIQRDKASQMLTVPGAVSFGYVTLDDFGQRDRFVADISGKYPELTVLDKPTFLENNKETIEESFLPIIRAIVVIAVLIGIAVIGLTIYTATIDKAREYGILKAIGVSNRQLYGVVLAQTAVITALGLALGIGLSLLLARGLSEWVNVAPQITSGEVVAVVGAALAMGALASLMPVRRLVGIDPAEVFKS